jgi:hypothetical protein
MMVGVRLVGDDTATVQNPGKFLCLNAFVASIEVVC